MMYIHHRMPARSTSFFLLGAIWGSNFLFMHEAVHVVLPLQVAWLRVCFGALPIVGYALLRKTLRWSDLRHAPHFCAMALLATVVPYVSFVKGAQLLSSGSAGAISGAIPLMTAVFAIAFLEDEKLTATRAIGMVIGLAGVAAVADVRRLLDGSSGSAAVLGVLAMLLGSAGYAGAMVYARRFITPLRLSPLALAGYQTAAAAIVLTAIAPIRGVGALAGEPRALLALALGLGLVGTGISFILYYWIIERLGAIAASSVFYLPPVVALLLGSIVAGEPIGPWQWCGTALILGGVFLSRKDPKRETKANASRCSDPAR